MQRIFKENLLCCYHSLLLLLKRDTKLPSYRQNMDFFLTKRWRRGKKTLNKVDARATRIHNKVSPLGFIKEYPNARFLPKISIVELDLKIWIYESLCSSDSLSFPSCIRPDFCRPRFCTVVSPAIYLNKNWPTSSFINYH